MKFLKHSLTKKFAIVAIILLIGGFAATKLFAQDAKPQYQTATVERGTLVSSVTSSGTITSGSNAAITTQATGIVNEVLASNGDTVQQGQTIATLTLDQTSLQKQAAAYATYLAAQNTLNAAKAKMNSLQSALFTANQKFVNGAGTQNPITDDPTYIIQRADWLQAEADYNNQKNVIAQAEAALSSASLSYAQTSATITAPIAGTVANLSITPGLPLTSTANSSSSTTTPSSQTIGNVLLKDASLTATVNLTEIDVTKVKGGQKVTLTLDAFPGKTFTGKVSAINTNGSISSGVTTYPTTITFDTSPDTIYPNMAVNATIITNVVNDVLLIPSSAVQTQNEQTTVRVLKNGKPEEVVVETGATSDTQTAITSGLQEGDTVITGTVTPQNKGAQSTSVFGGGFGGNRGFGGGGRGGGAGGAVFIQRR